MIVESMILGNIFTSLTVVYQAYAKIKSNKERCGQLVERCQLIVDRLQSILLTNDDVAVLRRIKDLEHTFKLTADTITKVGQQGYIVSVLRSEENAALIEDSQRALTELVSLLTLEQIIDVSAWQRENEVAFRRDNKALVALKKNVEQGTAAVLNEVTKSGATLEQIMEIIQSIAAKLGEPTSPNPLMRTPILDFSASLTSLSRPRSMSSPTSTRPSISSILQARPKNVFPTSLSTTESATRASRNRTSWANRLRTSPFSSIVSRMAPQSAVEAEQETRQHVQSSLSVQRQETISTDTDHADVPVTPPPAYQSWEEEFTAVEASRGDTQSVTSANSRTSIEAIRADDSPIPSPGSSGLVDFDKPLPDDPVLKVREALKRKEVTNFSAMKMIGPFGKINTRVLVEMWMLPKIRTFDRAIPLDFFVPIERDNLQLVKSRVGGIGESLKPMLRESSAQPEYNHVLMLCPREVRPNVIVIKKHQTMPQQSVKAYVLDTCEVLTLVSVKDSGKKTWLLIPYYPEMYVWEAKQYIQKHFGNVIINGCHLTGKSTELEDVSTLSESGVKSYELGLSMKISTLV